MAAGVPEFPIGMDDATQVISSYESGPPTEQVATLTVLGASPAEQRRIAEDMTSIDPADLVTADGLGAAFSQHDAQIAADLSALANWTAVSPRSGAHRQLGHPEP